jgi:hypothetical protein
MLHKTYAQHHLLEPHSQLHHYVEAANSKYEVKKRVTVSHFFCFIIDNWLTTTLTTNEF